MYRVRELTNTAAVSISPSSRTNCRIKRDRIQPILTDTLKGKKPGLNLIFPPRSSCVKHHQTAEGALPEVRGQVERQRHGRHLSLTHAGSAQRPHSFPHEAVHKHNTYTQLCVPRREQTVCGPTEAINSGSKLHFPPLWSAGRQDRKIYTAELGRGSTSSSSNTKEMSLWTSACHRLRPFGFGSSVSLVTEPAETILEEIGISEGCWTPSVQQKNCSVFVVFGYLFGKPVKRPTNWWTAFHFVLLLAGIRQHNIFVFQGKLSNQRGVNSSCEFDREFDNTSSLTPIRHHLRHCTSSQVVVEEGQEAVSHGYWSAVWNTSGVQTGQRRGLWTSSWTDVFVCVLANVVMFSAC